ncbi:MAG: metallophosphatase, partial [Edafosvirus sp.]
NHDNAKQNINDFRQIYIKNQSEQIRRITPRNTNILHEKNVKWLNETIDKFKDKKLIIMTHHVPSLKLINEKYIDDPINCCFVTDLEYLMKDNVYYWLSGHTHTSAKEKINNCTCIINPKGYYDENPEYNTSYVIQLDTC